MDQARLQWACRRGMLELDIVLERYLQQRYDSAPADEQHAFEALLSHQDPALFAWLVQGESPDEPVASIVAIIRQLAVDAD